MQLCVRLECKIRVTIISLPLFLYTLPIYSAEYIKFQETHSQAQTFARVKSSVLRHFSQINHHYDAQGTKHIRIQQQYQGFPIFGSYAILHHASKSRAPLRVEGGFYQKLQDDLGDSPVRFLSKADMRLQAYSQRVPQNQIIEKSIQAIVFVDSQKIAHWAYHIQMYVQPLNTLPTQPNVIIEESTGKILLKWDALTTLHQPIHGLGFGGNHYTGQYQYGKDLPYLDLLRDEESGVCFLENERIMIVDMHHRINRANYPMSFLCPTKNSEHQYWTGYNGDGYDQANGSYSVSNDALYFGEMVKKMYRERYGVEVLQNMKLIMRVHFSNYVSDAFWDGRYMTFGDGDNDLYPLVTLSVTAHELSHGFTQQNSGLQYWGQSGAINEAFSDMAAQAAEYYVYGKASWKIGTAVLKNQGALRWFQHPSRDGVSIERAIDYQNGMDVHYSSGVYNYLFYLIATHRNWDPLKAFDIMLKANRDYWTATTNFAEGACGILAAARDFGFSQEEVKAALNEVIIDYSQCT